jgi:hypothetical protein
MTPRKVVTTQRSLWGSDKGTVSSPKFGSDFVGFSRRLLARWKGLVEFGTDSLDGVRVERTGFVDLLPDGFRP